MAFTKEDKQKLSRITNNSAFRGKGFSANYNHLTDEIVFGDGSGEYRKFSTVQSLADYLSQRGIQVSAKRSPNQSSNPLTWEEVREIKNKLRAGETVEMSGWTLTAKPKDPDGSSNRIWITAVGPNGEKKTDDTLSALLYYALGLETVDSAKRVVSGKRLSAADIYRKYLPGIRAVLEREGSLGEDGQGTEVLVKTGSDADKELEEMWHVRDAVRFDEGIYTDDLDESAPDPITKPYYYFDNSSGSHEEYDESELDDAIISFCSDCWGDTPDEAIGSLESYYLSEEDLALVPERVSVDSSKCTLTSAVHVEDLQNILYKNGFSYLGGSEDKSLYKKGDTQVEICFDPALEDFVKSIEGYKNHKKVFDESFYYDSSASEVKSALKTCLKQISSSKNSVSRVIKSSQGGSIQYFGDSFDEAVEKFGEQNEVLDYFNNWNSSRIHSVEVKDTLEFDEDGGSEGSVDFSVSYNDGSQGHFSAWDGSGDGNIELNICSSKRISSPKTPIKSMAVPDYNKLKQRVADMEANGDTSSRAYRVARSYLKNYEDGKYGERPTETTVEIQEIPDGWTDTGLPYRDEYATIINRTAGQISDGIGEGSGKTSKIFVYQYGDFWGIQSQEINGHFVVGCWPDMCSKLAQCIWRICKIEREDNHIPDSDRNRFYQYLDAEWRDICKLNAALNKVGSVNSSKRISSKEKNMRKSAIQSGMGYNLGFRAALEGKTSEVNPFKHGKPGTAFRKISIDWEKGFDDGCQVPPGQEKLALQALDYEDEGEFLERQNGLREMNSSHTLSDRTIDSVLQRDLDTIDQFLQEISSSRTYQFEVLEDGSYSVSGMEEINHMTTHDVQEEIKKALRAGASVKVAGPDGAMRDLRGNDAPDKFAEVTIDYPETEPRSKSSDQLELDF